MPTKAKRILKGLYRSWSAHFSTIAIVLGGLEQYSGSLTNLIGAKNTGTVLMAAGIIGLALRAKTKESLETKGSK